MKILLLLIIFTNHYAQAEFFPEISGKTLNGDQFTTPKSLEKPINILVIAFKHAQQEMVDTWLKPLAQMELENKKLKYYEFPVMAEMGSWKRWMIYNGMKLGIRDTEQRSRTVSFHIDKQPFKEALKINEDSIYLFVVKQDGSINGVIEGVYSADKLQSLRQLISSRR
tara:strand:+ start:6106 stop:6609 length:504 start_codon:yes stop_codon:yes gene_type:complete